VNGHVVEQLSAFLDGELDEGERSAVARHLEACSECSAHLDELEAVDRLAASVPVEAPAGHFDGFASRVRDRIRKPARRSLVAPMWLLTAAATLLLAVTVPTLLRRQQGVQRTDGPAPEALAPAPTLAHAPMQAPAPTAAPAEPQDRLRALGYVEENKKQKRDDGRAGRAAEKAPSKAPEVRSDLKDETTAATPFAMARPAAPPPPPAAAVPAPEPMAQERAESLPESESDARSARVEEREQGVESRSYPNTFATPPETQAVGSERPQRALEKAAAPSAAFRALLERRAATIAEARGLREAWRAFTQGAPEGEADEARVRVIESGRDAFRLSGERVDLDLLRSDAAAYLKRADAHQAERVKALLRGLPR
jgi:hypothetical protein